MPARAFALALIYFAVAGCSGNSSDNNTPDLVTHGSPDLTMAQAQPDLTMPQAQPDLTMSQAQPDLGAFSCAAMVACTRMCGAQNSGQCVTACIKMGSADAMTWFTPLSNCAGPACSQNATDAGPPPCSDPSSNVCIACVTTNCSAELDACNAH